MAGGRVSLRWGGRGPMILSPAHRAGPNAARTCALAIALALALGGSRPAAAGRGGAARIGAGLGGLTVRKPDNDWRTATTRLQPKSERRFADQMRIRLAQRRRAPLTFPGLEHGAVTDEPNPWARYRRVAGTPSGRRPSAVAMRRAEPPGSKRLHPVGQGPAASRFSGGHGLGAAAAWLAGEHRSLLGDREVQFRGLQQIRPLRRRPLEYAGLHDAAKIALLNRRAAALLGQAAQAMNTPRRGAGASGALPRYDAPLQDLHIRFAYAAACAGRCDDMTVLGQALLAAPTSRARTGARRTAGSAPRAFIPAARGPKMAVASRPSHASSFGGRLTDFASDLLMGDSHHEYAAHTFQ